mmetsp:Transcript_31451/g.73212  ORF Transcript_31451/g.73212 Transcript_31451/m.73212 type:complete len:281 (+) Transcript_31451:238-1080(+)
MRKSPTEYAHVSGCGAFMPNGVMQWALSAASWRRLADLRQQMEPSGHAPPTPHMEYTPFLPATITSAAIPQNSPCSTTPTTPCNSTAATDGSARGASKKTSTMQLPLSVMAGVVPSSLLFAADPSRNLGVHPTKDGSAPMARMVLAWQKEATSTGTGNEGPSASHSFDSSTMTMNLRAHTSTIFSRSRAPPPPLTRFSSLSTASAPSIATSSVGCVSSETSGMPSAFACASVRTDVGIATIWSSSPAASFCPSRSTAKYAVDPVPRPTTIPEVTWESIAR